MKQVEPGIVMKYCQPLDSFVKIRIFTEEEAQAILKSTRTPTRREYLQLVVNACVVHDNEQVLPRLRHRGLSGSLEEILYPYCIDINPQLDLQKVTIPVTSTETEAGPHLQEEIRKTSSAAARARFVQLESRLALQVIGQDEAIRTVARALQRAAVGIRNTARPIGAFLFIGQTGVGKTELARAIARTVYQDPAKFIRIDCSEYALPHEYAKLIGAPPGYIGHDEGGHLTEAMKRAKEGVVLFDEIEKADSKVHNILLQLLDEGFVTDSKGSRVSFADSVIVMTSNLGIRQIEAHQNRVGFDPRERDGLSHAERTRTSVKSVKQFFRPEFVNRLDEVVVFRTLSPENVASIASLMLADAARHAKSAGLSVQFDPHVKSHIAQEGYRAEYGARELRRAVERLIETPLALEILDGRLKEGDRIKVSLKNGRVAFRRLKRSA